MIDAKTLMVGNWINVKYSDGIKPFQLDEQRLADLLIDDTFEINAIDCEYIPLSPDVLEKCGFLKVANVKNEYFFSTFNIRYKKELFTLYKHIGETFGYLCSIRYLHELQNIYYSIYKTELTYTP